MSAEPKPIVFVVDDDEAVRDGLSVLLRTEGFAVKTYAAAEEFLDGVSPAMTGCLVVDIHMPGLSGLELQAELARRGVALPVIVITGQGDVPKAVTALKCGAIDFLEKPCNAEALIRVVNDALDREGRRLRTDSKLREIEQRHAQLSPRECEVLELMVKGHPNKVIGTRLGISTRTVENHRARVMEKLGCASLSEVIHLALQLDPSRLA